MKLQDLIQSVKEKNLSKDQLEDYRDQMSHLYAEMQIEMAELEKEEALYFEEMKWETKQDYAGTMKLGLPYSTGKERSDISVKRMWAVTEKGQREIVLKRYCLATKELLNSLKSRLYSVY